MRAALTGREVAYLLARCARREVALLIWDGRLHHTVTPEALREALAILARPKKES